MVMIIRKITFLWSMFLPIGAFANLNCMDITQRYWDPYCQTPWTGASAGLNFGIGGNIGPLGAGASIGIGGTMQDCSSGICVPVDSCYSGVCGPSGRPDNSALILGLAGMGIQGYLGWMGMRNERYGIQQHYKFMREANNAYFGSNERMYGGYLDACTSLGLLCAPPNMPGGGMGFNFGAGIGGQMFNGAPGTFGSPFSGAYMGAAGPFGPIGGGMWPGAGFPGLFGGPGEFLGGPGGPGGFPGGGGMMPGFGQFGPGFPPVFGGPGQGFGCPGRPGCMGSGQFPFPNYGMPPVPMTGGMPFGAGMVNPWGQNGPMVGMPQHPAMFNGLQNFNHLANPLLNGGMDPRMAALLQSQQNPFGGVTGNVGALSNIYSNYVQSLLAQHESEQRALERQREQMESYLRAHEERLRSLREQQDRAREDSVKRAEIARRIAELMREMERNVRIYNDGSYRNLEIESEIRSVTGGSDPEVIRRVVREVLRENNSTATNTDDK